MARCGSLLMATGSATCAAFCKNASFCRPTTDPTMAPNCCMSFGASITCPQLLPMARVCR
ncbi:hypothetical protein PF005_g12688 [Phytophthora fragariae]|uniref:Uncharacterized protein n=2 Tax=Phytophthora TaxID=4783 RepID=A0A6A3Z1E8_9STRA|nr:hypothetical protein PF009_g13810 [Phytophthora fragariae]KAE9034859.1 hypothetical protein PR002_g7892 [Phytophthora rubi]KAE9006369.1 hypothetical protein PF011_g11614 [Phytophthora fragariae]KAE9039324.1 hypothetical protein PR001_g7551 [Phytophthora rubi]KAE9107484.1 hypothetical protein PF007_g13022 [Phytophthora fragariae]